MRILGIDYGEKRIGLAMSDELGVLAREFDILSPKNFFEKILKIVNQNEIEAIALGYPLNMSGEPTQKTREVDDFKLKLESIVSVPVEIIDERLSSQMASRLPGGKRDVDSLAAQIILQNYLDKQK